MGRHARQGPPEREGRCLPRPLTTLKLWIEGGGVLRWCATNNTCGENDNSTERARQDTHAPHIHWDVGTGHVVSRRARSVHRLVPCCGVKHMFHMFTISHPNLPHLSVLGFSAALAP